MRPRYVRAAPAASQPGDGVFSLADLAPIEKVG